jgi:uncharacterized membrane protein (UPF0127 family)
VAHPKAKASSLSSRFKTAFKPSNYIRLAIVLLAVAAVVIALVIGGDESKTAKKTKPAPTTSSPCGPYRNDGNVLIDGQKITVEIARNAAEFDKGLGGRPCILPNQGMWFAFKAPGHYPFWMKDMKFPIDIVWITSTHRVAAIEVDEQPNTYPDKFVNQIPAQYVLELKANRSKELHMEIGTPVTF